MAREELGMTPAIVPEARLQAVWRYLDSDTSGTIATGEFGRFMRLGEFMQGSSSETVLNDSRIDLEKRKAETRSRIMGNEEAARAQAARRLDDKAKRLAAEAAMLEARLASKNVSSAGRIRNLSVCQWDGSGYRLELTAGDAKSRQSP